MFVRFRLMFARLGLLVLAFAASLPAQVPSRPQPDFTEALRRAALGMELGNGTLTGEGGRVLLREIAAARFVLIGESHLTREIPLFTEAVCSAMHPDAYAVEAGPQAANFVQSQLQDPQRIAHMGSMLRQHPASMAFLDVREENDLAAACAASSQNPRFTLLGLDQEFLGAAGTLLDAMAATHPGPRALAAIRSAQQQERKDEAAATASGHYLRLYLTHASDTDLPTLIHAVAVDGAPETKRLLHELTESNHIYRLNLAGDPDSNRVRNVLMKQHFLQGYMALSSVNADTRVLFKFGDMHMGKGFSPLHQRELGNTIAELADAEGARSLHIMIFGAHGMSATPLGYRKGLKVEPFDLSTDKDQGFVAPALPAMFANDAASGGTTLTLFDLRALRFQRGLVLPGEWAGIIYSYDFLVLIPEVTTGHFIE